MVLQCHGSGITIPVSWYCTGIGALVSKLWPVSYSPLRIVAPNYNLCRKGLKFLVRWSAKPWYSDYRRAVSKLSNNEFHTLACTLCAMHNWLSSTPWLAQSVLHCSRLCGFTIASLPWLRTIAPVVRHCIVTAVVHICIVSSRRSHPVTAQSAGAHDCYVPSAQINQTQLQILNLSLKQAICAHLHCVISPFTPSHSSIRASSTVSVQWRPHRVTNMIFSSICEC